MSYAKGLIGATCAWPILLLAPAHADDFNCRGDVIGARLDSVQVSDGELCFIEESRIDGNIKVMRGGRLILRDVSVSGDLQAEGARSIALDQDVSVGGSVQIKSSGDIEILGAVINGGLQLDKNYGEAFVSGARVGGDLQAQENFGGVILTNNRAKKIECQKNQPPPVGGGNRAEDLEKQCRRLGG